MDDNLPVLPVVTLLADVSATQTTLGLSRPIPDRSIIVIDGETMAVVSRDGPTVSVIRGIQAFGGRGEARNHRAPKPVRFVGVWSPDRGV
jgi:hypothetical protein